MFKLLDYMEYNSDANAQSAYVSNGLGSNILINPDFENWTGAACNNYSAYDYPGTVTKESTIIQHGTYSFKLVTDGTHDAVWRSDNPADWANYKNKLITIGCYVWCNTGNRVKVGLNDGVSNQFSSYHTGGSGWEYLTVTGIISGSATQIYILLWIESGGTVTAYFDNATMYKNDLQSYSESTIKTQGSYSLKGIAAATDSLNKTLTRTISPTIDLTGINQARFRIRSSRTGSNIKIGLHDSGGTTTEITPNILSANTWQEVKINLQNVTNANKDAIDQIIITIVNADAENTFYIDELISYTLPNIVIS